jgi:20S proteasome alpha/beta subunit
MTLVCAIKCSDGFVLGSDGQAGVHTMGGQIRHQIQKIYKIGKNSVFMASGTIGLIQKTIDVLNSYSEVLDAGFNSNTIELIKKDIFSIVKNAHDAYTQYHNKTEGAPTVDFLLCGMDDKRNLKMWHVAPDTHDEFIDVVGCYCSGSGETFGYSLLKCFMQPSQNIQMGELIMYRAIKESINSIASGVGHPIDIWYIRASTGEYISNADVVEIHKLSDVEMETLSGLYRNWKAIEEDFLEQNLLK